MEFVFAFPFLLLPLIIPFLAGQMARNFGRKFWPWFIAGAILPFIAHFILLCLPEKSNKKVKIVEAVENEEIFSHLFEKI